MIEKVRAAIKDFSMLECGNEVTVALSGGADSMALLYALLFLQDEFSLKISAAHLNHGLRDKESDSDEAFVKRQCEILKVPFFSQKVDVNDFAKKSSCSVEVAARNMRYDFLKENSRGIIATAHTASDNFETVLFNLIRGTGVKGLCGIPPVRDRFIRPLIYVTREEVETFCKENAIPFVTDSSNLTDDYTRNFLRHNVVPKLKEVNPSLEATLVGTVSNLREDSRFLNATAQSVFIQLLKNESLNVEDFAELPKAIATRVLILYCEKIGVCNIENTHVELLYNTILKNNGALSLPGKTSLVVKNGFLEKKSEIKADKCIFSVEFEKMTLENAKTIQNVNSLLLKQAVDCDKIVGGVKARTRLPSDKISLSKRNVTKTLKKLFNEEGVPEEIRDVLPVVSDENGVIFVEGFGPDKRVQIDEKTKNILLIKIKKN